MRWKDGKNKKKKKKPQKSEIKYTFLMKEYGYETQKTKIWVYNTQNDLE
jgi:hypothetical protein